MNEREPTPPDADADANANADADAGDDHDAAIDPGFDFDRELDEVERFIAAVQAGQIGTSAAMAAYRDRHRPAIARLQAELDAFRLLLEQDGEDVSEPVTDASATGHPGADTSADAAAGDPEEER
jgi:hypothetical protein